ncbi:MAG: glutathione synthase [Candidatus Omnitrophota bacterium]
MNLVFLMDPLETVQMEKDTSFILMLEAHRRGHQVYFLPDGGMTLLDDALKFQVSAVVPQAVSGQPFIRGQNCQLSEDQIDGLFIRSDPPFDGQYLLNTWLLDRIADRVPIINRPSGIRTVNEKIWATRFISLVPPTLIGRNQSDLMEFLAREKDIIAKPTDGYGGQSVFRVRLGDQNTKVILENLTGNGRRDIILQKFIPESQNGDKRILLLNGEPLGAVMRVHAPDDHRNNFFSGGKAVAADINKRDQEIIRALKPELQRLGLYFVGIDILGDFLTEVNVTSPTCLQEMNRLYGQRLERPVINFMENLVGEFKERR